MRIVRPTVAVAALVAAAASFLPVQAAAAPAPVQLHGLDLIATLDHAVPGTAWSIDPATRQVVVTTDSSVRGTALDRLVATVAGTAGAARIEHTAGTFRPLISGGDAIYGGGYRCSLGFNVRSGSTYYFLTAGHCGQVASTWYADANQNTLLGPTQGYRFPGNDYALVSYANPAVPVSGTVGNQDITSARDPFVGEAVTRRGSTTGVHTGTVTGLNVTVHYSGGGTVRGLIQTNVCAEPGDSGGPLYDGSVALGLTSGGSGDCRSGGTTFFQPVTAALQKYGVSVF